MAAPTAPTATTLVTEGLKKAGYSSPSSALITRAEDYYMNEIKNDIWVSCKKMKSLRSIGAVTASEGTAVYSMPTDFSSLEKATLLYGDQTGTAQAGAGTSITLEAGTTLTEEWILGKYIGTTGGTGPNQIKQITAYNTGTLVATVDSSWTTNPASGTTYMICDVQYPLSKKHISTLSNESNPMGRQRPITIFEFGDDDYDEFQLFPVPDDTYIVYLEYYANLMTLDLAGTLISRLYSQWRNLWIQGVMAKQLLNDDDNRAAQEMARYGSGITVLLARETYGLDLSEMSASCGDY